MRRRSFFEALAAIPAVAPLAAAQSPGRGAQAAADTSKADIKLEVGVAEGVADSMPRFFTPAEFGTLRKVSDILSPAMPGSPGALAAEAPEFLDFLIGRSDATRQNLYRSGLDGINGQAKKQFNKPFADLNSAQAETLMTSLQAPWTYEEPSDPVARFLRAAKVDVRTATANSRAAGAGRRIAGGGLYWYPLD